MLIKKQLSFILTYKLSQDFLEIFFNAIRLRNGWNFNPTPQQFRYAFRQLLLHAQPDILLATTGNAVSQDAPTLPGHILEPDLQALQKCAVL